MENKIAKKRINRIILKKENIDLERKKTQMELQPSASAASIDDPWFSVIDGSFGTFGGFVGPYKAKT